LEVTAADPVIGKGALMVTGETMIEQLLVSFTVNVYVPADSPVNTLLDWKFTPFKLYRRLPVPPDAVTVILPSEALAQDSCEPL
jgi:hypothetical protein